MAQIYESRRAGVKLYLKTEITTTRLTGGLL